MFTRMLNPCQVLNQLFRLRVTTFCYNSVTLALSWLRIQILTFACVTLRLPKMQTILSALGQRIRELRERKKWSQEEFADRCGLHRTAVGLLEQSKRIPRLDTLLTISRGFGITVSDLLDGLEKRSQVSPRVGRIRKR